MRDLAREENYKKAAGNALRDAREAAGRTREQLADLAGTNPSQISRWENGHVLPMLFWIDRLSQALGCEVSALVPSFKSAELMEDPNGNERRAG